MLLKCPHCRKNYEYDTRWGFCPHNLRDPFAGNPWTFRDRRGGAFAKRVGADLAIIIGASLQIDEDRVIVGGKLLVERVEAEGIFGEPGLEWWRVEIRSLIDGRKCVTRVKCVGDDLQWPAMLFRDNPTRVETVPAQLE